MSEEKEIEQQASEETTKKPFKRFIFMGVAVILLIVGGFIIYDVIHYQSTDDAYVVYEVNLADWFKYGGDTGRSTFADCDISGATLVLEYDGYEGTATLY